MIGGDSIVSGGLRQRGLEALRRAQNPECAQAIR